MHVDRSPFEWPIYRHYSYIETHTHTQTCVYSYIYISLFIYVYLVRVCFVIVHEGPSDIYLVRINLDKIVQIENIERTTKIYLILSSKESI